MAWCREGTSGTERGAVPLQTSRRSRTRTHLVLVAHRHEGRHVHLIKGGEHGIGILRALETLSHAQAQARHFDAPLRTRAMCAGCGRGGRRCGGRSGCCCRGCCLGLGRLLERRYVGWSGWRSWGHGAAGAGGCLLRTEQGCWLRAACRGVQLSVVHWQSGQGMHARCSSQAECLEGPRSAEWQGLAHLGGSRRCRCCRCRLRRCCCSGGCCLAICQHKAHHWLAHHNRVLRKGEGRGRGWAADVGGGLLCCHPPPQSIANRPAASVLVPQLRLSPKENENQLLVGQPAGVPLSRSNPARSNSPPR